MGENKNIFFFKFLCLRKQIVLKIMLSTIFLIIWIRIKMHVFEKNWVKRTVFLTQQEKIGFLTHFRVFNPGGF